MLNTTLAPAVTIIHICRRGEIGGSSKKVGKRIKELERLYGIQNGGDRKSEPNYSELKKSQSDLAAQMGISVDTLQNYKMLAEFFGIQKIKGKNFYFDPKRLLSNNYEKISYLQSNQYTVAEPNYSELAKCQSNQTW